MVRERRLHLAWISYLDPSVYQGGGEMMVRDVIAAGRARGHTITESAFLRKRPQRALRRAGVLRGMRIDWDADVFVLVDLRNAPGLDLPRAGPVIDRVLATGRAVIIQNAWADVCTLDVPCGGVRARCPSACDRSWSNRVFSEAKISAFVSPMHRDIAASALGVQLPGPIVIAPYIDTEAFRPLGLERDIDVLYVGTIKREKGYYALLDRFGADRLTLAGTNALGEQIQGNYLGPVAYHELPKLYNRARIFAHLPEWHEPMGRTVVEAALCGCELVTNQRVGAMSFDRAMISDPQIVRHARTRFWTDFERALDQIM